MNPSINALKASDGSGNASVVTIQNARSPGATTIQGDTVQGINTDFFGTMGTPHTFTDPVTGETITVISEATAVDFRGHVDGSNLEIDEIAPGYTDAGSSVGDIVIIRPTTQWADNIASVLDVSLNDDGSLKAVTENPGWTALAYTPNTVTYLGNRSYACVFNSVDLTGALSNGMRLRTTRTVAAPTQCTSLNGTSQYYSKSSPNKLAFTDDFVVSAWIKVSSYAVGAIASRWNGTSGWLFFLESNGTVVLRGTNAGAGNLSQVASYQSVPLNKWVHVSAQLDMSAFTATTTTSYVMLDGVDVPATVTRGGTNPTALVQAGNLEIGTMNAGSFFPGKIAQVAIYNAKVTQANVRATISQGLSGSETSLASAYSFNNSITDLNTTTPNDLTANGSAVATNADSPFGGQAGGTISSTLDYGIIQAVTASTLTVQVPEGCTIPTSGGVSAVSYSSNKAPYGFPSQENRWYVTYTSKSTVTQSLPSSGTWYNLGSTSFTAPVGVWVATYRVAAGGYRASSGEYNASVTLSTSSSAETITEATGWGGSESSTGGVTALRYSLQVTVPIDCSSATTYYLLAKVGATSASDLNFYGGIAQTVITLKSAYL